MKTLRNVLGVGCLILFAMAMMQCEKDQFAVTDDDALIETRAQPEIDAGNNLSFPVIWADDAELTLRGDQADDPLLEGEWWYVWGPDPIDPNSDIYSCPPDPDNLSLCADGSTPGEGYDNLVRAYLQKDPDNIWQAGNGIALGRVNVIDWGDNLESVNWTLKSQVRTEVVLYKILDVPMTQYLMKHVSGWGINEVHGLAVTLDSTVMTGTGDQATVYSDNARLTIQKLNIDREDIEEGMLEWIDNTGWTETDPHGADYINEPIFSAAIYEDLGYSAEVNVKGKIMYGYTWNVKKNNEGEGDYRLTFSIDDGRMNSTTTLAYADILVPVEEFVVLEAEGEEGGGGVPILVPEENLTYIDIRITGGNSGQGGGSGNGGGNGGGNGNGNGNPGGPHNP